MSMNSTRHSQVAKRYAEALFQAAAQVDRQELKEEFQGLLTIVADEKVHHAFHHPRTTKEHKNQLIKLMNLSPIMENFLLLVVEKSREGLLPAIGQYFEELVLAEQQTTLAEITSAVPLTEQNKEELQEQLQRLTGKTVLLRTQIDPKIMGGLVIKVDGKIIDGSVKQSLHKLQQSLSS